MRKIFTILALVISTVTYGQAPIIVGSYDSTDENVIRGFLKLLKLKDLDSTKVLATDVNGRVYLKDMAQSLDTTFLDLRYVLQTDSGVVFITPSELYTALGGMRDTTNALHDSLGDHWAQIWANYVATSGKIPYSDTALYLSTRAFLLANYFANGGNTFGATATLGTNGSNALDFETNGVVRGRIGSTGNWMVGTTTDAGYKLDVNGISRINGWYFTTASGVDVFDFGAPATIRIANENAGRYIEASNGLILRNKVNTVTRIHPSNTDLIIATQNNGSSAEIRLIPNAISAVTQTGIQISAVRSAPSSVRMLFNRMRNDGVKSAIINTEDFSLSGATPVHMYLYAGKETIDNNQGNLILQHDGTIARGKVGIGVLAPAERLEVGGNIKTAEPTASGAGAFKIGKILTGTDANKYLEVEIDGVDYYIRALTALP